MGVEMKEIIRDVYGFLASFVSSRWSEKRNWVQGGKKKKEAEAVNKQE
jgi:hypothetical protein